MEDSTMSHNTFHSPSLAALLMVFVAATVSMGLLGTPNLILTVAAFNTLIERYHGPLLRLARSFVHTQAIAEEVVNPLDLGTVKTRIRLGMQRLRDCLRPYANAI